MRKQSKNIIVCMYIILCSTISAIYSRITYKNRKGNFPTCEKNQVIKFTIELSCRLRARARSSFVTVHGSSKDRGSKRRQSSRTRRGSEDGKLRLATYYACIRTLLAAAPSTPCACMHTYQRSSDSSTYVRTYI